MLKEAKKELKKLKIKINDVTGKIKRYLPYSYDFLMNHYLGSYSIKRRLKHAPLSPINHKMTRIDLKGKKILLVVAHCDDETIWANTILTSDEPSVKDILIIYDGGESRNEIVKKISQMANANLFHLEILRDNTSARNEKSTINEEDKNKIRSALKNRIHAGNYDFIFTHNEFGEYGHGHHRAVHDLVQETCKELNTSASLVFFGFAFPLMYKNGLTYWEKSLKVFSTGRPWKKQNDKDISPFKGIFKFKKFNEYFFHDDNAYLPQKNKTLMMDMVNNYRSVKDAWVEWLRPDTFYYKYLTNHMQFFSISSAIEYNYIEYEWPEIKIKLKHPMRPGRLTDIRTLLNDYLIDYLHFEGRTLWVGWDKFCIKNGYYKKIKRYAENLDLLDNKDSRKDRNIYGEQTANIIGDICNLKNIVPDEIYDSIFINGVLEYVDSIDKAVSECARILKKHGRILIGTPGYDYNATGWNRPKFDDIIKSIYKNGLIPIEVWQRANPDFYFIHIYKI